MGASGAIFGLYGGLTGFLFIRRHVIPAEVLRPMLQNGLYFLGANLVLGFSIPGVDVAAHVLGAVAGFVGGVAATWPQLQERRSAWLVRNALLTMLCLAVVAATPLCIPASAKAQARFLAAIDNLDVQRGALLGRYDALIKGKEGTLDGEALAEQLEQEVLQPWSEMQRRFPPLAAKTLATPPCIESHRLLGARQPMGRALLSRCAPFDTWGTNLCLELKARGEFRRHSGQLSGALRNRSVWPRQ